MASTLALATISSMLPGQFSCRRKNDAKAKNGPLCLCRGSYAYGTLQPMQPASIDAYCALLAWGCMSE
eukprot:scaffold36188_cov54-Attheya_sp.AAC.1